MSVPENRAVVGRADAIIRRDTPPAALSIRCPNSITTIGIEGGPPGLRPSAPNRIDYDDRGNLDDVALGGVEMFRLEYMDARTIWIAVIRKDGTEDVFWLRSKRKI